MQRGNDAADTLKRQQSRSREHGEGVQATLPAGQVSPRSGVGLSGQPGPLQHYVVAGQLQQVAIQAPSPVAGNIQQVARGQVLAPLGQSVRAATNPIRSPTGFQVNPQLSPLTPQPLTPQSIGRLFSPVPSPGTGYSASPSPNSMAPQSPGVVSPLQRQLSSPAGMMVVPPVSPSRGFPPGSVLAPSQQSPRQCLQPLLGQQDPLEHLQIIRSSAQTVVLPLQPHSQVATFPVVTAVSASGGTIHHLGHSPPRSGLVSPLVNPVQHSVITAVTMSQQQTSQALQGLVSQLGQQKVAQAQTQRRLSMGVAGPTRQLATSAGGSSASGLVKGTRLSPVQSPERPRKKIKIEEKPPANAEIAKYRKLVCDAKLKQMSRTKESYKEHLTELFFLQNGGNIMDYFTWKRRPTPQLLHFLRSGTLDSDDEEHQEKSINNEVKVITTSGGTTLLATPVAISTTLPPAVAAVQYGGIPLSTTAATTTAGSPPPYSTCSSAVYQSVHTTTLKVIPPNTGLSSSMVKIVSQDSPHTSSSSSSTRAQSSTTTTTTSSATPIPSSSVAKSPRTPLSPPKSGSRPHSISAVYESTIGSQETIVERAKQEAQVLQRIAELRKDGLWSSRRLPKVQEPARNKAHWDYLLEEMQWLAADFAQERKWKKAGARKIARMITKYHQERQLKELKAEKEESQKLKRIAGSMSKMVKEFWSNIEKVVEFKQQSRMDEKRKKALDLHLSFIVDQTEKYSSWLTEGLGSKTSSRTPSINTSPSHSIAADDGDFQPSRSESDDEETIEKEEGEAEVDDESTRKELEDLQKEGEMPLEDLIDSLPQEVLEKPASLDISTDEDSTHDADQQSEKPSSGKDAEFKSDQEESEDDEQTLEEQETHERSGEHTVELNDLQEEGDLTIEELRKKYAGAYDPEFEAELSDAGDETEEYGDDDEEETEEEEEPDEDEEEMETDEDKEEVGMEYLMTDLNREEPAAVVKKEGDCGPGKDLTDIAAAAQSIQPTGYTLETTQVRTVVPFLLKHTLREYQHVGLDWLATLYARKLNGILADEMGLGKTIQTIALLAHLACERGIWGPHLIVVPTSVMLNWEMELKKWCPAFKILTYYGTQKERKLKRQGWTKTNAFHVCITSYKLVIQDHQAFRRKKWKYFILDEAQNIKNFKSQRWQTLLNFRSQRRLLLTGTPLQNSLMELWSLMHFLMPHVFASHREFKEWFANPMSGMIEGSREYNENLIKRLHKVLRPFLLRRLKKDVEKQMPKKYEHVVMCRLSKRQRFLYDDFMSQAKTKDTLATGHFMSVINILMQLRKVCNHPNLFDPRPITSPFQMQGLSYVTASLVLRALEYQPLKHICHTGLYPCLATLELRLPAFAAHRTKKLHTPRKLIEEIDSQPDPPPRPQRLDKPAKLVFRCSSPLTPSSGRSSPFMPIQQRSGSPFSNKTPTIASPAAPPSPSSSSMAPACVGVTVAGTAMRTATPPITTPASGATTQGQQKTSQPQTLQARVTPQPQTTPAASQLATVSTPVTTLSQQMLSSQPITVQIHHTQQGTRLMIPPGQLSQLPAGFIQIVQTSTGQQIIATTSQPQQSSSSQLQSAMNGPTMSTPVSAVMSAIPASKPAASSVQLPTSSVAASSGKPMVRVAPMYATTTSTPTITTTTIGTTSSNKPPTTTTMVTSLSTSSVSKLTSVATSSILDKQQMSQVSKAALAARSTSLARPVDAGIATRNRILFHQQQLQAEKEKSPFYLESLEKRRVRRRREKLTRLARANKKSCDIRPVYGQDLSQAVDVMHEETRKNLERDRWKGVGCVHCQCVHTVKNRYHPDIYWRQTDLLADIIHTPEQYLTKLSYILDRFVFLTPPVMAPRIRMHTSHPPPSLHQQDRHREFILQKELAPRVACLHRISSNMCVQFPEARLIQYDCGKLQTMDVLLRDLKSGQHRVLIFTQMTKMLDVLEAFLNYHGHRYLRLDGSTKVEQRQLLMERFNMDKRIFCFILSTRSGGIGVNLTGADTVIFYDSDWNPTMDAQAQDRCHRIGQTRDVHIYRLISERTVEENILKKANQKRQLGDVAIEGGQFTTAFFQNRNINDLFEEPSGLQALAKEKTEAEQSVKEEPKTPVVARAASPKLTEEQIEQALCAAEDETDIQAAKVAKAEQKAELAEFDEDIPWDEREAELKKEQDDNPSFVEQELAMLEKELTPVERYAVTFFEKEMAPFNQEELQKAEEDVTIAKEEWEFSRLKALKEEEERRAEYEEDEMLFTYTREDAYNQVYICDDTGEHMPMWTPPTPPQDDNDIYIDHTMCFLYEPSIMPESQLPPVYIKKEYKRIRVDPGIVTRKHKVRKEEQPRVPRSLFDRPIAALRRDAKIKLGLKQGLLKQGLSQPKPMLSRPVMEHSHDHPEWLIHEDWALLQAVQSLLELPLTLSTHTPAHIPNWDLVADIVNATSRTYRSPKQCKNRYENVVVPREEGRILYDINPRKQKKSKGIYKTKNNRPMRTSQLFVQNNNGSVTTLHTLRFDTAKNIASKRTPTLRPTLANPTLKNPKHAAVLAESGINYDQPLTPKEVAEVRKQRIAKEKAAAEQQLAAQRAAQQPQLTTTATGQQVAVAGQQQLVVHGQVPVTATTSTIMAGTLQQKTTVNNPTAAAAVSLARSLGATGGIVVNTAGGVTGNTFALSKRLGVVGTVTQATSATATTSSLAQAVRAARTQPISVQELAAVVNQGQARMTAQGSAAQVITTTTLTPAQLVAAQKAGTITASGIVTGTLPQSQTKTLTQTQLQMLRLKQQQAQLHRLRNAQTQKFGACSVTGTLQKGAISSPLIYSLAQTQVPQSARNQTQKFGACSVTGTLQKGAVSSPLIYSLAQTQVPQSARNQGQKQAGLKQGTVTRSVTPAEIAALLKNQSHLQQSKVQTMSVAITQASPQLQQVQVSQGQVTRLTPAQIIAGAQVQQVQGQSGSVSQPVATLVKTVASQPNVTIPMNALSLGISVTVPQQKTVAGKAMTAQQMRHIQLQQLQRKPASHFQQAQKVATLTSQLAAKGQTPLIIPQQHGQQSMPKVMVHQLPQFVKQHPQAATIQQIITSMAPQHPTTTTATVIATQLLNQAASTQAHTITKMSVPTSALTTAIAAHQARVTATAATTGVATIPVTVATSAQPSHMTGTPTVTLTPSQATLVKHVQEVVVSPQKTTIPMHTGLAQQLKAIPQTATVRHIHGTTAVTQQPGQSIAHTVTVQQLQQSQAAAAKTQQPSPSVQAAVQQVVQQAQAQAAAAHRHQAAVVSAGIGVSTAVAPTTVTVQSSPAVTVTQQAGQQQVVVQSPGGDASQAKASPHQMRLRNQKT